MQMRALMLGSDQPDVLRNFYEKMFGKPTMDNADDHWYAFEIGAGQLVIGEHSEVKGKNTSPGRLMFMVETDDVMGEFERMKAAGAEVIAAPYSPGEDEDEEADEDDEEILMATLADPDGNYFQLSTPWSPDFDEDDLDD